MYLFGASGHAKVIIDTLSTLGVKVKGFYDDDPIKKEFFGLPVFGGVSACQNPETPCIISIGDNRLRKKVAEQIQANYRSAIHPQAILGMGVSILPGTVMMAGAVINVDSQVGSHCIINTASSVDHDCILGDFVHISPQACLCGGVQVGEGSHIGSGATIIPGISIGKWAVVGAGAVVIEDVPDGAVVVGNPAKIKKLNQHE